MIEHGIALAAIIGIPLAAYRIGQGWGEAIAYGLARYARIAYRAARTAVDGRKGIEWTS